VAHDDYLDGDIVAKMRHANSEGILIAQIETARGLDNVEKIAAVPGIDVLWIGHFDLTNSLGSPPSSSTRGTARRYGASSKPRAVTTR
jgi:2-dehydro-3-deoxyglucarate aldolase/4-hydroxy-2-oxoheptanedioate aldolase